MSGSREAPLLEGIAAKRWALACLACALVAGCGRRDAPSDSDGRALGAALLRGLAAAAERREPWPCASPEAEEAEEASETAPAPVAEPERWRAGPGTLTLAAVPTELSLGFIADAGGAGQPTLAGLRRAAALLAASKVTAVLSLGGLAADEAGIEAALRVLVSDHYLLVASPGDLEPVPAHRAAVARLARAGARIVDGSRTRWLELGIATVATLPGARHLGQLSAGPDGCGFDDGALEQTATRLGKAPGLRVLAAWAAPRPDGATAARGDLRMRQILEQHHVELAVVGEPTGWPQNISGSGSAKAPLHVAFTGFSDGEPRMPADGALPSPSALLLQVTPPGWSWRRLDLSMQPTR